jgi:hypothetical protein
MSKNFSGQKKTIKNKTNYKNISWYHDLRLNKMAL